jgi:AbrB family looped-hinge helix DNA binding protein
MVAIIKVTKNGRVLLPSEIRESLNIKNGDELLITSHDDAIIMKKTRSDSFEDIIIHSEDSLKEVWDNEEDDIWASYLKK